MKRPKDLKKLSDSYINAYKKVSDELEQICRNDGDYYSHFLVLLDNDGSKEKVIATVENDLSFCFDYDFDEGGVITMLGAIRIDDIEIPHNVNKSIRSKEQYNESLRELGFGSLI